PQSITYLTADGVQHIRVFAIGSNDQLVSYAWDGGSWTLWDIGWPNPWLLSQAVQGPNAIAYEDAAGVQQIRVFAQGFESNIFDGDLVAYSWSGNSNTWMVYKLGLPSGVSSLSTPAAISYATYKDVAGTRCLGCRIQQIRVFATGRTSAEGEDSGH